MPRRLTPALLLLAAAALWPVWLWYAHRLLAAPEERAGLLALGVAVLFCWRTPPAPLPRWPLLVPAVLLLAYAAAVPVAPPLVRAVLGITALVALVSALRLGARLHVGLWGLALLALPVLPSLQFYLGYPLRAAVAQGAAPLLRGAGYSVLPEGACLRWGGALVAVDAPCSGVRMLWTGLFLALALAVWLRLSPGRTIAALGLAFAAVLAGNVLRAVALFFPEAGALPLPAWGHAGIGTVSFLLVAAAIAGGVLWLHGRQRPPASGTRVAEGSGLPRPRAIALFLAVCVAAAVIPCWTPPRAPRALTAFPGWPAALEGTPLRALPLSAREARFSRDFPGRVGRFSDGRREWIIRWVTTPTRTLHPAADCFRGSGYRLTPLALHVDAAGRRWGACLAARAGERLRVRECIVDGDGRHWSDVSAWYWAALLDRTRGPWWAYTVAERAP
ncbi:MAG TPA: archaeosortase/exosortase family protein [Armatimonadota bacterium]|nr:archaeosortase/exosortase family protein [Armatimonadota bacterium]